MSLTTGTVQLASGARVDAVQTPSGRVFYTLDGQSFVAWRNGNGTFVPGPARNEKFDEILDAEREVQTDWALATMGSDMDTRHRAEERLVKSRARQSELVAALTDDELREFFLYRRADRKARGL
jgi:hypothetical protein